MGIKELKDKLQQERREIQTLRSEWLTEKRRESQIVFDEYMISSREKARANLRGASDVEVEEFAVMLTENRFVDEWLIPPHWTSVLICEQCGYMPCLPEDAGRRVICCSWCAAHPEKPDRFEGEANGI
jgi:hypothetical protein